ncbi:tetrathionate reductase family octaheme c-type cytochrome [Sedimenticola hydrogenitrophicus]|uniref:tetrathionate reductase family octaheme c-type cytochrome n=1 Tax=Sedimenticola hydrogenitrophicus TaxID=2967975 RepID=UPI0021A28096|nr:tetrathionate reductase family octaheme c-type cytochrome [Sedimenticola hydrogenitrophicus]
MIMIKQRWVGPIFPLLALLLASLLSQAEARATEAVELGITEYADTSQAHRVSPGDPPAAVRVNNSTADHAEFKELRGPFSSGPEVTRACLDCHNQAGHQFMQGIHWTWEYKHPVTGQLLGKKHLVNNFCTNARGNEGMCAQCHAGYGWKDDSFDFSNQDNIDCLVCHDATGSYYRTPNSKGNAACSIMFEDKPELDLAKVAQSVALPSRSNCGTCHFYGGGGDGVKHGDMDSSLKQPDKALDVHMDAHGLDFGCTECHQGEGHQWSGSRYHLEARDNAGTGKPGQRRQVATCESCHGDTPHPGNHLKALKLNGHTDRVACQTCHIPTFARGGVATKTDWAWRTAGRLKDGEGFKLKEYTQGNGEHRATYKSIKGDFKYGENLKPSYAWFDGVMNYTTIDTKFDPQAGAVKINAFSGAHDDPDSRIWPFKQMHTTQPYDKGNNTLVYMHLWGDDADAYWGNYDFGRAIKVGMEKNGKPYSGEYGFVETVSYWPITHMVAPREDALACAECHAREGRLSELRGFYMPGRDGFGWLDMLGYLAVIGALLLVLGHAVVRMVMCKKRVTEHCRGEE